MSEPPRPGKRWESRRTLEARARNRPGRLDNRSREFAAVAAHTPAEYALEWSTAIYRAAGGESMSRLHDDYRRDPAQYVLEFFRPRGSLTDSATCFIMSAGYKVSDHVRRDIGAELRGFEVLCSLSRPRRAVAAHTARARLAALANCRRRMGVTPAHSPDQLAAFPRDRRPAPLGCCSSCSPPPAHYSREGLPGGVSREPWRLGPRRRCVGIVRGVGAAEDQA